MMTLINSNWIGSIIIIIISSSSRQQLPWWHNNMYATWCHSIVVHLLLLSLSLSLSSISSFLFPVIYQCWLGTTATRNNHDHNKKQLEQQEPITTMTIQQWCQWGCWWWSGHNHYTLKSQLINWSIESIDWSFNHLIDHLIIWLIAWLTSQSIDWSIDWSWLIDHLINCLITNLEVIDSKRYQVRTWYSSGIIPVFTWYYKVPGTVLVLVVQLCCSMVD